MKHQRHLNVVQVGVVARELRQFHHAIILLAFDMEILEFGTLKRVFCTSRDTESRKNHKLNIDARLNSRFPTVSNFVLHAVEIQIDVVVGELGD